MNRQTYLKYFPWTKIKVLFFIPLICFKLGFTGRAMNHRKVIEFIFRFKVLQREIRAQKPSQTYWGPEIGGPNCRCAPAFCKFLQVSQQLFFVLQRNKHLAWGEQVSQGDTTIDYGLFQLVGPAWCLPILCPAHPHYCLLNLPPALAAATYLLSARVLSKEWKSELRSPKGPTTNGANGP